MLILIFQNCRHLLSQNRKLDETQKNIVKENILMKGNKLKLMNQLMASGKTPILRDISNIRYKVKEEGLKNSLLESLHIIEKNGESRH